MVTSPLSSSQLPPEALECILYLMCIRVHHLHPALEEGQFDEFSLSSSSPGCCPQPSPATGAGAGTEEVMLRGMREEAPCCLQLHSVGWTQPSYPNLKI